jgi:hypothetical protein
MSRRRRPYLGPSDAQANADALARRSATYADEHARSWEVRFDRPSHEPRDLRELVRCLRRAYADEVPGRLHTSQVDGGGTPAYAPEFARYLYGSEFATDQGDGATTETYLTPFRRALASMDTSEDEGTRKRAWIVSHVVLGGAGPAESAILEGVPSWCAKDVAERALAVFWRRLSDVRLDLYREAVA